MSSEGSITRLLNQFQVGDRFVAQQLWERYFHRLVALARLKLSGLPRGAADEEDVALSAFASFCRAAEQGRFPRLNDRDDLWQVLVTVTTRKAVDLRAYEGRDKRDWRRVQQEAEGSGESNWGRSALAQVLSREPDPAFAAEVADQCRSLLGKLRDDELRLVAMRKMEGFTNEEIAGQMHMVLATVERRLRLIRKTWEQELADLEA
jgi:DNA-directed RNA polymerase specialized sigma24 family protein